MKHWYFFSYPRKFLVAIFISCFVFAGFNSHAQLVVTPGVSTATLLSSLVGQGMTVSNVSLNCANSAYGTFSNGNTTNMGITNGILLTTGNATSAIGPNNSISTSTCHGTSFTDPQLTAIDPLANEDVCILEFDVVPQCNTMQVRFVFGSEEYPEFVNSSFNDAFGFFISGPGPACQAGFYNNTNVATLPNNVTPVSIDNVNAGNNAAYYINNNGGTTIQYDGFTTILTRSISLCPCQTYHWKIAIADAGDCNYDSGVFLDFISCANALTLSETHINTGCSGCTGSANVTLTGGTGPFSYTWSPAPGGGQGTPNASGLCAGTYTLSVVDALSCSPASTIAVTITSSGTLTLSGSQTNITCNGSCTGSATTTIVTGTGPFTYAWTPSGGTGASATGLCAGTYTCTVTASGGCTAQQIFTITQPPAIAATQSQTNILCNGLCTGSAAVVASGGTGVYTYSWAPSGGTGATATGLCAGTYTCTIASGSPTCTITRTFTITQPPALAATQSQTNILCNGACTGAAAVVPSGGTAPYSYSWAPSGGIGPTTTGRCFGTYTCTITDANGCSITRTFNITQPTALTTTGAQSTILCNGGTGSATVTPSGGTGPYSYSWAPSGGAGATAIGLFAGTTYTVTVTDASGCTATRTFTFTQPTALAATQSQTNILCNGTCTGSAAVVVSGGTGPYSYAWTPTGGIAATTTGRCFGNYTCTITDANGCTLTRTFNITQPTALTTTGAQSTILCNGGTGSATVTPSGGTGPYSYSWAPTGGIGATATGLLAGTTYTVTVTDASGCTATRTFTFTQPTALTTTGAQSTILCNGGTGSATVTPSGGTGPYSYSWAPTGGIGATATGLLAGTTYTVTVTDANGCTATRTFTFTQPTALAATQSQTNILCNGACTGSAAVVASGGTGPYSYAWTPTGGIAATTTGRCFGNYTCTITDANGCTLTRTFNITQPTALTTTGAQSTILCNGGTGSATVTPSGGTGPYGYSWAPSGGTGATATGLLTGTTYTVTVTDANGCTATRTFTFTQPTALAATTSTTPATCGNPNGSASVSASGGTGPYSYAWAPSGGTGATATGLLAGSYTCTITDASGCTLTRTITVVNSGGPTANISAFANVSCFGGSNGSATVVMVGGTGPFTYAWSPSGGTGATASGLIAGVYVVTVTDANGCIATATATITQPPAFTSTAIATPALCNGGNTGTASVSTTGGAGGNNYNWTPGNPTGDGSANVTGLTAGTWSVTVTDVNGCTTTATVAVTQPTALATTTTATAVLCNGGNTGSASVNVTGGTGPYNYNWTPGNPTGDGTNTITGLTAATWSVTVTDANGCTTTATVNVTQPTALAATTSFTQATCGNSNGSAAVSVTGGVGPYSYAWSPSGGTGATASGLTAGAYTVIYTDANGCTGTATVNVPNAGSPTAVITTTVHVSCFGGNNGSATVSASGGTGPYTYAWAPTGGTGATGTALIAGPYTVTVTDANGCSTTATVTITQPPVFTSTATATPALCNGGNTGTASVSTTGGAGGNTYNWTPGNPTGDGSANVTGLTAGTWSVTVTDVNGCTTTATVAVTQPTALATTTTSTAVLCNGGNTGSASVSASGGTGPYTYSWSPSGGTGATATGLIAGAYVVTVTDANGCTTTATVNVTQPTVLAATTSFTQATCGNSNGSAAVSVTGGVGPYSYAWSPSGGTGATATALAASIYTVIYTDANGCTGTATVNVPNAGSPTATITATVNVSCFGGNNGSATVAASGGTGPYTYAWTPTGGTGTTGTALIAGPYTVTVTDANGCSTTATVTITQPPVLTSSASSSPVLCFGGTTGSATVTATGGVGPYTYVWSPSGGTGATATGLGVGVYTCITTDANGCTTTATTNVTQPTALAATTTATPVLCNGGNTGAASVTASGGIGPYTYSWSPSGGTGSTASNLVAGPYVVTVTDANGCTVTATATITEPTALAATTSFTQSTCGNSNGSASVSVSGGIGPYTYAWSPSGGTGATATGLAAAVYTVIYTDANGCTGTATVNVPNAGSPTATITATVNVSCFGGNNGSATVTASGGTGPYTYAWAPTGGTGTTGSPLIAGPYTVTVTDANGCSTTASVTITEPPVLTSSAASTAVLCFGGNTGTATVTPTGGVGPYTYLWSPSGGTGANATGLTAGPYTVVTTDANGCTTSASVTVSQPTALTATATATAVLCFGGNTGSASVTASGGIGPYTYAWSPSGGTGSSAVNLIAGPYTCVVTDANGCTFTVSVTVTEPPALAATTSFTQSTCGSANGSASVNVTGGTGSCTYIWSPAGGTNATATGLLAGTYTVVFTDANGCVDSATVNVPSANSPTVSIGVPTMVSCFGGNNGSATASSTGGTTPYTYLWSNADPDSIAGNLIAGTYTVTVTDANGCTDTAAVTITEPPLLTAAATSTDVLCFGGNTGTAAVTETGGVGPYTYSWSPSGGTGNSATGLITSAYVVTVTDANGCTTTASTTVNEPALLTLSATFTPVNCNAGNDGTTTATAAGGFGNYTYLWSPSGGTNATATGLIAGVYSCVVTDDNGCTASASVTVTEPSAIVTTTSAVDAHCNLADGSVSANATGGTGTITYQWLNGGPATAIWNNVASGTYSVVVTDQNGCSDTLSQVVQNLNGVTATLNTSTNLTCFNSGDGAIDIAATGGTLPYTYSWTPNASTTANATGLSAGNYVIVVTDSAGCTSTVNVLITEPTMLTLQASANPTSVCEGTPVQLSANAGGGTPAYSYSWTPGPLAGQTQNITPAATTTYTCTVTDANGCTATSPILVTVNPMPVALFTSNVTSGCAPLCVDFTDQSTVASGTLTGWLWDFGDNTTSTQQTPSHCYNTPGVYTVILTITTNAGCTQTITMANYISVYAVPVAAFGASPQPTTILNPIISFTDSSSNATSWLWSFGDVANSSSTDQHPTFTYPDPTCYFVLLEVTSQDGCIDTASQLVCIDPDVSIYVPNTFTPDGNGTNDVFIPVTVGMDPDEYELWIFDRWGNMIFYSDELDEGWDGRVQGAAEICQIDTYVWKIKVKDLLGNRHDLIGHVNLVK